MRIFEKILSRIFGPSYICAVDKKISRRVVELRADYLDADAELNDTKSHIFDISWYKLVPSETKKDKPDVIVYMPFQFKKTRTMKDLLEKREKEKKEQVRQIQIRTYQLFETVERLIQGENVEEAESLLFQASPMVKEINKPYITKTFNHLLEGINGLKETLRQREVNRRKEEERKKDLERKKRLEQERLRRQQAEEARLQRLREAQEYEERIRLQEQRLREEIERLKGIVTQQKGEANEILDYLKMKGVRCFYHFTDKQNYNSIRKYGGLLSWHYCKEHDIIIPNAGGDSLSRGLDIRQGLQDYVRLSFCNDHPMAYRKHQEGSELYLLKVSIDVAAFESARFSDRNAASNSFSCGSDLEHLKKVNINATQRSYVSRQEGEIFSLHQAECMIKTFIPIEYIININNPQIMRF